MGCDIHLYVETRGSDGRWVTADKWTADEWAEEDGALTVDYDQQFYNGRNYNLFAILADVRNGRGFAGVKTGAGFNAISEPKGVPDDACPEFKAYQERYGCDGHSHSYLTVEEIIAFDWTQTTTLMGFVGLEEWARFASFGEPESYSGGVWGGLVTHHDPAEFDAAWNAIKAEESWEDRTKPFWKLRQDAEGSALVQAKMKKALGSESPYCQVSWDKTYYACCQEFLGSTLPRLWALGKPEDVRIVFFFDN